MSVECVWGGGGGIRTYCVVQFLQGFCFEESSEFHRVVQQELNEVVMAVD